MAATGGSSAQPLDVRRQASLDRQAVNQPVALLLQQPTVYAAAGYANLAETRPGRNWKDWGTLLNRKVVICDSKLGPGSGRGLFAGPRDDTFEGFKAKQVITIYGGKLLTKREVDDAERDDGGANYILRISAKGGSMQYWVDGKQFADGLTRQGDVYLPAPEDADRMDRMMQGAASLANDPVTPSEVNAEFKFYQLGTGEAAKLRPRVPVLVAKRNIAPDEEIFVSYGTDKPLAGGAIVAEGSAGQGRNVRPRLGDAGEVDAAPPAAAPPDAAPPAAAPPDAAPPDAAPPDAAPAADVGAPTFRSLGVDVEEDGSSSAQTYGSLSAVASDEFAEADEEMLEDEELLAALARL